MSAERIVIRSVNWLGDAVMTTPALVRLREARPNAHITILTHEKLADLWKDQPFIDDVIAFTSKESVFQVGRRLRWGSFQIGVTFPNSPRSALELWHGRIPERIGYARSWRNLFLTQRIPIRAGEVKMRKRSVGEIKRRIAAKAAPDRFPAASHHIHQYLNLVSVAFGANPAPIAPQIFVAQGEIDGAIKKFCVPGKLVCGLNPCAEYGPAKRWLKDRFISAAVELHQQANCHWIVFGGKPDAPLSEEIAAAVRDATRNEGAAVSVAGKTSLRELCALLKGCRVLLTNDTGPMHVAAAVGTPVVVPFGSTSPDMTAPGLPGSNVHRFVSANAACSPCFLRECPVDFRCMNRIEVKDIVAAAQSVLAA